MGEVDEENESQQDKEHGSYKGYILAPDLEEGFGDEEGHDDQGEPNDDLRAPVAVLQRRSTIPRGFDAE